MLYFVQDEKGHIKIGHTAGKLADRLRAFQTGSPSLLTPLLTIAGDPIMERYYHQEFAAYRVCGEWFLPGPKLIKFMLEMAAGGDELLSDFDEPVELPMPDETGTFHFACPACDHVSSWHPDREGRA